MLEIVRTASRWVKTPRTRRGLLFQAAILAGTTRALLRKLPLMKLRRTLASLAVRVVPVSCSAAEDEIVRALSTVNRRFGGTCLANALAAQALLTRYGYPVTLQIGANWKDGNFAAHAWVERNGEVVIGGPASFVRQYTPFPQLVR
jgi:hypothetical protein